MPVETRTKVESCGKIQSPWIVVRGPWIVTAAERDSIYESRTTIHVFPQSQFFQQFPAHLLQFTETLLVLDEDPVQLQ